MNLSEKKLHLEATKQWLCYSIIKREIRNTAMSTSLLCKISEGLNNTLKNRGLLL